MNKVLFDTNIVLDIALKREPYFSASSKLFTFIDQFILKAYVTGSAITDIYYIIRKQTDRETAKAFLLDLIKVVPIIGVDQNIVINAIESDLKDFEDAVQVHSAIDHGINYIITRNKKDFKGIQLGVFSPEEAISFFSKETE